MKYLFLVGSIAVLAISGCSSGTNSVGLTPTQGQCVQASMYSVTPPAILESNPIAAPYCMAVTIQNNNSGKDANNIQITSSSQTNGTGLVMSYTVGTTSYSAQMGDSVAAQLSIGTQTLGNVSVYDPYNCLTTQGANVITLNSGGGNCTFYLQLTGEANPVGVYGINLNYNYTNGNSNYNATANVNQRVNLYAGSSTGNLYVDNNGSWTNGNQLPVPIATTDNAAITGLASDAFGNVYIATLQDVYVFNGITVTQLNLLPSVTRINGITTDVNGFLYAATNNGVYKYNTTESIPSWGSFFDIFESSITINTQVTAIKSYPHSGGTDIIYATTESAAYSCNTPTGLFGGCAWALVSSGSTTPNTFTGTNGISVDISGNLYAANGTSVNSYITPPGWQPFAYFNESSANLTGVIDAIYWSISSNIQYLYVGEFSAESATESSIYVCTPVTPGSSSNCTTLLGNSGNSLTGNIYGIITDGSNNVYAVGNTLNSTDFSATYPNQYGASLVAPISESGTGSSAWTPIQSTAISGGNLSVLNVSSMLTTY